MGCGIFTGYSPEEIASAFFTVTEDLDAEHPALAARQLGWHDVALLCAREIPVPGSLGRVIRVLLHVNTAKSLAEIRHVYLREAVALGPAGLRMGRRSRCYCRQRHHLVRARAVRHPDA